MFSSVFEYFSPSSKRSSEMDQKARLGESVGNSAGAYWKHPGMIRKDKTNVETDRTASVGKMGRKTKELEEQHRPEGNWFQPEVGQQPSYQSRMVWDLTNNCYQELPVQQVSSYPPPAYHQIYPCPAEELDDSVTLAPTALPLVDLFGGVFMEFVDTLYTSTLVQYVCERTAPSEHRMAAEVLARSNLNPNAKEFSPSQERESDREDCGHSGENVNLKEELKEKEYSADETEVDIINSSKIEIHTVPLEAPCDNSTCDIAFGGEEFGEDKEDVHEESCETEKDEEESEDWWDSDEEPCTPSQEIDPAEFEDLFCCPLSLSSLHPTKQPTHCGSTSPPFSTTNGSSSPPSSPSSPSFTSVATISLAVAAPRKADTRLENVNRTFNEKYSSGSDTKSKPSKVRFSEEATWEVIEEPEELADDLCEARCSDLEQRRADRERMERLLGPVLTAVHRRRMYCKIYGDPVEEQQAQEELVEEQIFPEHLEEGEL